ncbi:MAG: cytidylate kinase family protein [Planctomycetes bacterium]|nr:cytidylate kinase family protein [Planctomycetota bacterium]
MIITISGAPGSGKSSVAQELARRLDLKHYSIGDLRRRVARERGMTIDQYNRLGETTDETDREPDEYQARLGREEDDFVIDSRLGFHFIPQSFRVRLDVEPQVGAQRIFRAQRTGEQAERRYQSVEEVLRANQARETSDRKRYQMYYGVVREEDRHYDLVVDTTEKTIDEVVGVIIREVEQHRAGGESR